MSLEKKLSAPVTVITIMVDITDIPLFKAVGTDKKAHIVTVQMDTMTGAYLDRFISKYMDVTERDFEKMHGPPDEDDAGSLEFARKLRTMVQAARDTAL